MEEREVCDQITLENVKNHPKCLKTFINFSTERIVHTIKHQHLEVSIEILHENSLDK